MSDVEDELLALAGGDVSDEEEQAMERSDASDSPAPKEPAAKAGAKKISAAKKKHDDSEEEGEA
jgi:RNA polymerase-associated protein RTF1